MLEQDGAVAELAQRYRFASRLVSTARGYSYPTAREAALKLMETSYLSAQAFSGADLLHGPLAMIDPQVPVLTVVGDGVGGRAMQQVLPRLADQGADVFCVGTPEAVRGRVGRRRAALRGGRGAVPDPGDPAVPAARPAPGAGPRRQPGRAPRAAQGHGNPADDHQRRDGGDRPTGPAPAGSRSTAARIVEVGDRARRRARPTCDLGDRIVVPGFVDIHVHGGGGGSFTDLDPDSARRAVEFHRAHGTTSTLASLVTASPGRPAGRGARCSASWWPTARSPGSTWRGRGCPSTAAARTSPACCATPTRPSWPRCWPPAAAPSAWSRSRRSGRGALAAIRTIVEAGVVAAVGHTDTDLAGAQAAVDAGATVATHLFNAMPAIHHRDPGPVVALLNDPRVTTELIVDGTHVDPDLYRMVNAAGRDTVALVTDAMAAAGRGRRALPAGQPGRDRVRRGGPAGPQRVDRRQHRDHGPGVRHRGGRAAAAPPGGPGRRGPAGGHHPGPRRSA